MTLAIVSRAFLPRVGCWARAQLCTSGLMWSQAVSLDISSSASPATDARGGRLGVTASVCASNSQ